MLIHDYLEYWAQREPDRVVITDGEQSMSRAEFLASEESPEAAEVRVGPGAAGSA